MQYLLVFYIQLTLLSIFLEQIYWYEENQLHLDKNLYRFLTSA